MADDGIFGGFLAAARSVVGLAPRTPTAATNRTAFTAAVIGLSAKLSKADGVTLKIEADTFERLFAFPASELGHVRRLFALASQNTAGFESYAAEVARSLADQPDLKCNVFEALLHIASADGILHPGEDQYLTQVARAFGYSDAQYKGMRAHFIHDANDPYTVVGAERAASNSELKARYLRLVREHHPDALAGKGLGQELRQMSERKLAIINAAWDEISKERGL